MNYTEARPLVEEFLRSILGKATGTFTAFHPPRINLQRAISDLSWNPVSAATILKDYYDGTYPCSKNERSGIGLLMEALNAEVQARRKNQSRQRIRD